MSRKTTKTAETTLPDAPFRHVFEVATLSRATETAFDLQPDPAMLHQIAAYLGIASLQSMRFKGKVAPRKKENWQISARLTAAAEQDCVITLEPVAEKIDEDVLRDLIPAHRAHQSDQAEIELGEEDEPDLFEDSIDIAAIALEQLALALDPYPRASGAALQPQGFAGPGDSAVRGNLPNER